MLSIYFVGRMSGAMTSSAEAAAVIEAASGPLDSILVIRPSGSVMVVVVVAQLASKAAHARIRYNGVAFIVLLIGP